MFTEGRALLAKVQQMVALSIYFDGFSSCSPSSYENGLEMHLCGFSPLRIEPFTLPHPCNYNGDR